MAKGAGDKGLDGRGMNQPGETTPGNSVSVGVRGDAPGGESSNKTWVELQGPNPGTAPRK